MNSKYIMIASAVVMGLLGIAATFLPNEILSKIEVSPNETLTLIIQVTGALYFGFAVINWMAKTVLIGGIYARPLAMGNFAHFTIAAIALIKAAINNSAAQYILVAALVYGIFAVLFGRVLFTNPAKANEVR